MSGYSAPMRNRSKALGEWNNAAVAGVVGDLLPGVLRAAALMHPDDLACVIETQALFSPTIETETT